MTKRAEIGLLRLVAQRLAGTPAATVGEAVGWLTATQAQDLPGALTSVALRTRSRSRSEVVAALDSGEVVRSWPLRGTLHLVRGEDLPWLLDLLAPRELAQTKRRRAQLGLDEAALESARELAVGALAGGRRLTRAQLLAVWQTGGPDVAGQRGYHLLGYLARTGTLCLGPWQGGEQLVVLLDDWVPQPRRLDRDEALGELAARFFAGHGPATVPDLARWAGMTVTDARAGAALARPHLECVTVEGQEYLLDPRTPELLAGCRREARGVFLLPGFDEFVLGYGDRDAVLAPEHAAQIVPGGNGVFRPTVVSDGRVIGTWRRADRRGGGTVSATPFDGPFPPTVAEAVEQVYASLP